MVQWEFLCFIDLFFKCQQKKKKKVEIVGHKVEGIPFSQTLKVS